MTTSNPTDFYPSFQVILTVDSQPLYLTVVPTADTPKSFDAQPSNPTELAWAEDRLLEFVEALKLRSDVNGPAVRVYRFEETSTNITP